MGIVSIKKERAIKLISSINEESATKISEFFGKCYEEDKKEPVMLWICSGGGDVGSGWGLYDFIKMLDLNLITLAFGHVSSMAIPIFCLGKERYVSKHTLMYVHETGSSFKKDETIRTSEMRAGANKILATTNWQAEIVSKASGGKVTKNQWLDMMAKEKCLNSKEMLRLGIAHKII
jgi:ATP-dependent protease ClpP protease subunit